MCAPSARAAARSPKCPNSPARCELARRAPARCPAPPRTGCGGEHATVTDANVVLGYLPASLLGGEMTLDRDAAHRAVRSVADALGIDLIQAAQGIIDVVNENMFGALRLVSVEQGYDPRGSR